MGDDDFKITRRHLPHWTMRHASYFITFRTRNGSLTVDEQITMLEHIKEGDGKFYELSGVIIMPDHVHAILSPHDDMTLSRIMKGIKGAGAHKINRLRHQRGPVWQDESFDRIIRDERDFSEKMQYMFNNPAKNGLTDDPWNYHGWYGGAER